MYTVPESGLLYFLLARSTHIASAYKEGRDIVVGLNSLRRLYIPGRFFFKKRDNFCDFLFGFLRTRPVLKRVHSKRKELAPKGSQFFPFREDPFS